MIGLSGCVNLTDSALDVKGGLYLNGVDMGTRMEGTFPGSEGNAIGSCEPWLDWEKYTNETKQELSSFAQSTMDAFPVKLPSNRATLSSSY
jgi:hypothetical protein